MPKRNQLIQPCASRPGPTAKNKSPYATRFQRTSLQKHLFLSWSRWFRSSVALLRGILSSSRHQHNSQLAGTGEAGRAAGGGRGLGAAGAWLGLSLLSGIFTAAVAWLVSALLDNPSAVVLPILVAYSAWGTAAWWLGEIPTSYEPRDDLARART